MLYVFTCSLRHSRNKNNDNDDNNDDVDGDLKQEKTPLLCSWMGCWADLKKHIDSCPLHIIHCRYCNQGMMRKDYDEQSHLTICSKFPVSCKWCKLQIPRCMMNDHIVNKCSLQMVECNACNERMMRGKLSEHIRDKCPEVKIRCRYYKYGCMEMVKRKEMRHHIESEMDKHLKFVEQSHEKLESKVSDLKNQIVDLTENKELMQETIDELKYEHEELKDEYQDQIDDLQLQVNGLFDVVALCHNNNNTQQVKMRNAT